MTPRSPEHLYELVPRVYRVEDARRGYPLRAFVGVLQGVYDSIAEDLDSLYDSWFIETCDDWVIPYIGELVGVRGAHHADRLFPTHRARVANAVGYARRKGVPWVIGRAVGDASGWSCRVVELFELLGTTQTLAHLRPGQGGTLDVADPEATAALGGPFERAAHTVDVRATSPRSNRPANQGLYNVPNVGVYVWRLQGYPLRLSTPARIGERLYTFHPAGVDTPLYNVQRTLAADTPAGREWEVPGPLSPETIREALVGESANTPSDPWFGSDAVFAIHPAGNAALTPKIEIADLDSSPPRGQEERWLVDPRRGRLAIVGADPPDRLSVSYAYGFSADMGGGPYDRSESLDRPPAAAWLTRVGRLTPPRQPLAVERAGALSPSTLDRVEPHPTLGMAVVDWPADRRDAVIRLGTSATESLPEGALTLNLGSQRSLFLQAENGERPCLRGDLVVRGHGSNLTVDGLLLDGSIHIQGEIDLTLRHCTVRPRFDADSGPIPSIVVEQDAVECRITIAHCIVGGVRLPMDASRLTVADSIVDGPIEAPSLAVCRSTILGPVNAGEILAAEDAIFYGLAMVDRPSSGEIRYCYVPPGSVTPARWRCQPDMALAAAGSARARAAVRLLLQPVFASLRYGDPAYGQLAENCPPEICAGASSSSEMGVFSLLRQPQRRANLDDALREFLPAGLTAAVCYVT